MVKWNLLIFRINCNVSLIYETTSPRLIAPLIEFEWKEQRVRIFMLCNVYVYCSILFWLSVYLNVPRVNSSCHA